MRSPDHGWNLGRNGSVVKSGCEHASDEVQTSTSVACAVWTGEMPAVRSVTIICTGLGAMTWTCATLQIEGIGGRVIV